MKLELKKGLFGTVHVEQHHAPMVRHEGHKGIFSGGQLPKGLAKMQEDYDDD